MELYLIRHGTTDWNAQRRFQGREDIELNEKGRELAGKLGQKLENVDFDFIFSSPLIRAYETACLIRGHRNIQIIRDPMIEELSFGKLEGMPYADWIKTDHPRKYFFTDPIKYQPPEGGESFEEACQRTKKFIKEKIEVLYQSIPDGRIMIVSHGALLASMMCYLEKHGIENFWGKGLKGNCEETVYSFDGQNWTKTQEEEAHDNPYEQA